MDVIRLFLHLKPENNKTLIERSLSGDNIKSFLCSHPSSSSLSSCSPLNSSQLERCSGLSISLSNKTKDTNIVASASASISNARSFTSHLRRHSWTGESLSSIRRTKSFRYQNRIINKYEKSKIVQVNCSTKSVSFPPLSTNINNQSLSIASTEIRSIKTTTTNAFLTAASLFKYWVDFYKIY